MLPLRNRASAMHFFVAKLLSIAVMTYSYIYDLTSAKPTSDDPANFYAQGTPRINFSMQYCFCVYAFPGIHTQETLSVSCVDTS